MMDRDRAEDGQMLILTGRMAAPGFAAGPVFRLPRASELSALPIGSPEEERARFDRAVAIARGQLAELIGSLDEEGAAVLEFQLALLEDDELLMPVHDGIRDGLGALDAWTARMDAEIAVYEADDDAYFQARAADLTDLRDRIARELSGTSAHAAPLPPRGILVAEDLAPSAFLERHWTPEHGIALMEGSTTAHVAILARGRGVPMLVGLGHFGSDADEALLDGPGGRLILNPDAATRQTFESARDAAEAAAEAADAKVRIPAATLDGEPVATMINIGGPEDLDGLDPAICDGIGLVRTEFLFHGRTALNLPDEEEQLAAYTRILTWARGKRVIIRTLDAGADKPIPGLTLAHEGNPFLGLRGVRLSLRHPDSFRIQLRALLRAAAIGPLDIMIPMVSIPAELADVRRMLEQERTHLADKGVAHGTPRLGMMVEVPAAALMLDAFTTDFASIGSNDLTQYVMAAGRDSAEVGALNDAASPAVLRLIEHVVDLATDAGIPLSLCGDAGGDPAVLPYLLGCGLRSVSMAPPLVAGAKAVIRGWSRDGDG